MKPNFKRNKERRAPDRRLYAPISGKILPLNSVSDPVYAAKMYGEGVAIVPNEDLVVSPAAGTLVLISVNRNSFGIETESGEKVYVHVGLGAPETRARGFEVLLPEGSKVRPGQPIFKIDRKFFDNSALDMTTVMIVTTSKGGEYRVLEGDMARAGKTPVLERK